MTASLVEEFGIYPSGCCVLLASGESDMVVKRGATVSAPIVAMMVSAKRVPLQVPVRRDSSQPAHAVLRVLAAADLPVKVPAEWLMAMIGAA